MRINELYKKLLSLEKRVEFLESKLKFKRSSADLRDDKWNEFQSIIRLQEKSNNRKAPQY
ncbi:MAG: hypothetical protein CMF94_03200 [Candidatus Marinimicrobia bacterium]|nr:hypothetical protein [Candidatus Neomarinimicrobiota bacterium]